MAGIWGTFMERGLHGVDSNGEYYADLATEAPTVANGGVSNDGLTVTCNLRDGAVWSDGDPFDCDDVVFTYDAIMHPNSGAQSTSGYADIDAMLRVAGSSADLEERKAIYQTVAERVSEEVPMIFLYNRSRINRLTEDFMGFKENVWSSNNWNSQDWWLDG